jgi:hypothetical protein
MSCFGIASNIIIRSYKHQFQSFQVEIKSIFDQIVPTQDSDREIGTTIIIKFGAAPIPTIKSIIAKYFWDMPLAQIAIGEDICSPDKIITRSEVFKSYSHFGRLQKNKVLTPENGTKYFFERNFDSGRLYLWHNGDELISEEHVGDISVLCAGIFVCDEKSDRLLPKCIAFLDGAIDVKTGQLDLAASRENFIKNEKFDVLRARIATHLGNIIASIVDGTKSEEGDSYKYLLREIFVRLEESEKELFFESIDAYGAITKGTETIELLRCREREVVYVYKPRGRFVGSIASFNGDQYYKKRNDRQEIAKLSLERRGYLVVEAQILKEEDEEEFTDYDMITAYLSHHDVDVIDISEEHVEESELRSLPVSARVRKRFGFGVKFVDFGKEMEQASWFVDDVLYLNVKAWMVSALMKEVEKGDSFLLEAVCRAFSLLHSHKFEELEDYLMELAVGPEKDD